MKIAILGTRGVPPSYGGFETFAGELSMRLVQRGHEVSVYCRDVGRASARPDGLKPVLRWNGVERIVIASANHKYFETVSHAFLSALDALRRDFDAVLVCNAANAFVLPLLRAARIPCAINVDGIERKRRKWNVFGRAVYAIGETFSVAFANRVVADAEVIAGYYREHYAFDPDVIPYGSEFPVEEDSDVLERLGIREYVLYVSRFEPENNPLEVLDAASSLEVPLVMVGKGLYAKDLVDALHARKHANVILPGALYGRDYRTLQRNARVYIQATEVGGTHPALIEAMGSGGVVLALDTPENREVGGDAVGYFRLRPRQTLSGMLREWLGNAPLREEMRARARHRASALYSWDRVTDAYERLFQAL
ncbi:MAG TPA: glycosyltransferase [Thermoanaerobaculia bacterium]|nr:glycosyltransferase [Thermoanaerobaculia bacterium]